MNFKFEALFEFIESFGPFLYTFEWGRRERDDIGRNCQFASIKTMFLLSTKLQEGIEWNLVKLGLRDLTVFSFECTKNVQIIAAKSSKNR